MKKDKDYLINMTTEFLLELKDIDLGILEIYNGMPADFKEKLSFAEYYRYYREKVKV